MYKVYSINGRNCQTFAEAFCNRLGLMYYSRV